MKKNKTLPTWLTNVHQAVGLWCTITFTLKVDLFGWHKLLWSINVSDMQIESFPYLIYINWAYPF